MQSHKLVLDIFDEDNFNLIAIHSSLQEYRLAFFINKYLNIQLARALKDVDFKHKSVQAIYVLYKYYDEAQMSNYFLIGNQYTGNIEEPVISSGSLFGAGSDSITTYLVPEFKKADYFVKIEDNLSSSQLHELVKKINQIPQITSAYAIEPYQIKSKENLIFE